MEYIDKLISSKGLSNITKTMIDEQIRKAEINKFKSIVNLINLATFILGMIFITYKLKNLDHYTFIANGCLLLFNLQLDQIYPDKTKQFSKRLMTLWITACLLLFIGLLLILLFNIQKENLFITSVGAFLTLTIFIEQKWEPKIIKNIKDKQSIFHKNFAELNDLQK